MATITSSGLGSGLDVDSIVSKLIAADRSPVETRLDKVESKATAQISALGALKSAMSLVNDRLTALTSSTGLGKRSATVSDTSQFSVTTSAKAQPSAMQIEVLSLAKASKIGSGSFASSSTAVGAGSFTIGVGAQSFSLTLDTNKTVADLRDAINNAMDNKGVSAALVQEDGGVRLVLTSKNTGTASALSVTASQTSFSTLQAPTDAQVKIDGYTRTSSFNTIRSVVEGVDIDLLAAKPGNAATLTIANDNSAAADAVSAFVDGYNAMVGAFSSLTAYNAASSDAGALIGDPSIRSASQSLRSMLSSMVNSGTYQTLSQIGITTKVDGTLEIDDEALTAAIKADTGSVQKLFGNTDGIATRMGSLLKSFVADDGQIDARLETLEKQLDKVEQDRTDLDTRMEKQETLYRTQFSSLDAIVSKYNNVASYLDQMDQERYDLKS